MRAFKWLHSELIKVNSEQARIALWAALFGSFFLVPGLLELFSPSLYHSGWPRIVIQVSGYILIYGVTFLYFRSHANPSNSN